MKTELTQQEENLIPIIREKWLSRFFSDRKLNEYKLNDYIKFIYCDLCKLKMPQIVVVDSPYGAQIYYNILKSFNIKDMANIGDNIGDNIWDNIRANIGDNIGDNIRANIRDNIWDNIRANIRDNIWANIWANIRDNIGDNIRANIRANIWANIRDEKLEFTPFGYYGDCSDFGWVAFYDYFDEIKIDGVTDLFKKYRNLFYETNPFMFLFFNCLVIAIRHPTILTRNDDNRLHNITGPAVVFGDGYFQHYVHGIYFTKKEFETYFKKKVTFPQIMKIDNAEKRCAVLMERKLDVIKSKLFKLIGEDIDPSNKMPRKLYEFIYNTRKKHVVVYHDSTHNDKTYATLVPTDCVTPHDAIIWMNYGIDTDKAIISS